MDLLHFQICHLTHRLHLCIGFGFVSSRQVNMPKIWTYSPLLVCRVSFLLIWTRFLTNDALSWITEFYIWKYFALERISRPHQIVGYNRLRIVFPFCLVLNFRTKFEPSTKGLNTNVLDAGRNTQILFFNNRIKNTFSKYQRLWYYSKTSDTSPFNV